jgi:mono/diheme cytochrome c family protein
MRSFQPWPFAALLAIVGVACSEGSDESADPALARGESLYRNICQVCHNADPNVPGALGPAIAGAPLELLEAKVLRGEYPPGYTPARDTKQMPQLAYLEPHLADVAAFLAAKKQGG